MSAKKEQKSHATAWVVTFALLPVLYVLSTGPTVYLELRLHMSPALVAVLSHYNRPVANAYAKAWPVGPLKHYWNWWIELAHKP